MCPVLSSCCLLPYIYYSWGHGDPFSYVCIKAKRESCFQKRKTLSDLMGIIFLRKKKKKQSHVLLAKIRLYVYSITSNCPNIILCILMLKNTIIGSKHMMTTG